MLHISFYLIKMGKCQLHFLHISFFFYSHPCNISSTGLLHNISHLRLSIPLPSWDNHSFKIPSPMILNFQSSCFLNVMNFLIPSPCQISPKPALNSLCCDILLFLSQFFLHYKLKTILIKLNEQGLLLLV